jgi:hypothetical protein
MGNPVFKAVEKQGREPIRAGILAIALFAACCSGAAALSLKGKVVTNDSFPGSDVIVSLKTLGICDTTDTAGFFLLTLPSTLQSRAVSGLPENGRRDIPASVVMVGGRADAAGWNFRVSDLLGRLVDIERIGLHHFKNGVFVRQSGHASGCIAPAKHSAASALTDTLIVSYGDSIQKKMAVSLADTGKNLSVLLTNDLAPKGHRILAASYSNNAAFIISATNTLEATYKMPGAVQDAWRLANGNLLLSGGDSVREVDKTGKIVWGRKSPCGGEMHNCQPLPGGKRFFGENCTGKLFIADSLGTSSEVPNILMKDLGSNNNHSRFRMVRKYDSLFLVTAEGEGVVYLFNSRGETLRKIDNTKVSRFGVTFNAVHSAILLPDGNILIGSGYTGFFIEVDKKDSVVWKVSASDLPGIGLTYAAGCQRLRNGNTICSAYNSSTKFFEITRKKRVVWKSNAGNVTGNPTHVFLLDIAGDPAKGELLR